MDNIISKEIKLIAVYGRVSTSAQEIQETIEAQLLEVHKFADERGYTIVKEYLDNGWSGDTIIRPALDELRLDAKKHIWEAVLIYDPDRLGRRYFYQELVMDELKQLGIETLFVTVPPVKDLNDRMMGGMRGIFAEYERAKISERFRIGKVNRINMGNVLVSEAPYGYTYKPNTGKRGTPEYKVGHLEINENEAKNVKDIFRWVADEGLTLRAVVRRLQELGIGPRKSKRGVWNTSTLSTLLRNKTYIGIAHWGASHAVVPENPTKKDQKYKKNKKTSRRMNPEDKWLFIKVPRIIEDDIFYRAGQKLRENFAIMGRNKKNEYLLAGKIWCICGKRRAGEGPQCGKHLYYRCTDRVYSFPLPRSCYEGGINAKIVDKAIWGRLKQIMSTPEIMRTYAEKWINNHKIDDVNRSMIDNEDAKKELLKLKNQEDRYTRAYSEGIISIEKLKEFLAPLKDKISLLEKNLTQACIEQKPKLDITLPNEEEISLFAKEAINCLDNLNFTSRKGIIRKAITTIYSNQKDLQVHGCINLNEIYVKFITNDRNRRFAECGEVNAV